MNDSYFGVSFPGEIVASRSGQISIAVLRATLFGTGVEIWQQYVFKPVTMEFDLRILIHEAQIIVDSGKVFLNGVPLN